jgi:hypothetical protein
MDCKILTVAIGCMLAIASTSALAGVAEVRDISPLWRTRNNAITDNFYTTDPYQRDASVSCCGYQYAGVSAYVLASPVGISDARALKRFYKGAPTTEHFYTTSDFEADWVLRNGFVYEGTEGALFSQFRQGLSALHRLSRFEPGTGDLQHYYTTNAAEIPSYQQQGWTNELVAGYAFAYQPNYLAPGYHIDHDGRLVVSAALAQDPAESMFTGSACGGKMTVTLDGAQYSIAADAWTRGFVPPSQNTWGCWAKVGPPLAAGSHSLKLVHAGFAARISGTGGHYWKLITPNQANFTFTRSATTASSLSMRDSAREWQEPAPTAAEKAAREEAEAFFIDSLSGAGD